MEYIILSMVVILFAENVVLLRMYLANYRTAEQKESQMIEELTEFNRNLS